MLEIFRVCVRPVRNVGWINLSVHDSDIHGEVGLIG
jgi:hypothetical protein